MIRLMTYNIRAGRGVDNRRSIRRIADVIRKAGARIICLQEVEQRLPTSRMVDQPDRLARSLGMQYCFQRNLSIGIGGFGNALLTNLELTGTTLHKLTSKREQRGVVEAHIATPDGPLAVFCTHFGLDGEERLQQARELAAMMNACDGPKLACGDFNEEIDSPAVSTLIAEAGLVDAAPGGSPTFDSTNPRKRIDLVLCDPSVRVCRVEVILTPASDHLPVVADITMSP
jgi:endonuclease/exonuclease/phosphatase family metal-dependent hydrolase